ncbi:AbrB/MazE/SpoVT family DNA-binding domain-containing protein [Labilibaculum filiforme]
MYSLDELLEGINETNIHEELLWGDPEGNEEW